MIADTKDKDTELENNQRRKGKGKPQAAHGAVSALAFAIAMPV
jgi:hypothetical protein